MANARERIAVVGGGVAGITAAYLLGRRHDVTVFERNDYLGGHTNTRVIADGQDAGTPVDTGFIVCNRRCYPCFYCLMEQLGVELRNTVMSFSFYSEKDGWGYRGPQLKDFLGTPANLLRPSFVKLLWEQRRFGRRALDDLENHRLGNRTLGQYLREQQCSEFFVDKFLVPLAAAVWSSPDQSVLGFHAATFLTFWRNHGILDLSQVPQWQTVVGGSHTYVKAFRKQFSGEVRLNARVGAIARSVGGVYLELEDGEAGPFDQVVLAAHADQSLAMLAEPNDAEGRLLGAWRYQRNPTVLHTDTRLLPPSRGLWAAWNYLRPVEQTSASPVNISYWMNRLQGLKCGSEYVVTLNESSSIAPEKRIYEAAYEHPVYTPAMVTAQHEIRQLNGTGNTYYCGSYMGYGFHEDAVRSACDVAEHFGIEL